MPSSQCPDTNLLVSHSDINHLTSFDLISLFLLHGVRTPTYPKHHVIISDIKRVTSFDSLSRFLLHGVQSPTYPKQNTTQCNLKNTQHKLTCFAFLPQFLLQGVQLPTYPKPNQHTAIQPIPPRHKPTNMFRLGFAIPSSRCSESVLTACVTTN
jgi:hypothetical protein